jgi:glyoxylase-like metal-dependent hydrolase (beta-lactamase superfamily II)
MTAGLSVGEVSIIPIYDGFRYADVRTMFDRTVDDWRPHRDYVDDQLRLRLEYGALLVRTGDSLVLVDPGCAPGNALDGGHLFESLRTAGLTPTDITHVIFTHLHMDHVGSAVTDQRATFAAARYFCHEAEWSFFAASPPPGNERDIHRRRDVFDLLRPIGDRIDFWTGTAHVARGVTIEHAPGHTPGSAIVVIGSGQSRAMLLGDVVHCPVELTDPEWGLIQDVDPALAKRTRFNLTARIEDGSTHVTAGHFPGMSFGRVLAGQAGRRWLPS